jgi:hypothetical protein
MYISFSDAPGEGFGGAAQGIIPVQDAEGNMLGGGSPASPELAGEVKREARNVKTEVQKLEDHFEKMMAAVERNTEKVAELADRRARSASDVVSFKVDSEDGSNRDSIDMGVLSGHFVRMNDLLSKNSQHVEELTKKHQNNEQKLRQALESFDARQKNDYLDMQQLSSHLDRIQSLMEDSAKERKDSAREIQPAERPLQIDLSPLTDRLEKVQAAVEQNSSLIKALLDEGDSKVETPFWGRDQAQQTDLSALTPHLERIHGAVEQQGEHMRALVKYASGELGPEGEIPNGQTGISLAPLAEHLEQIYNAIEEGNKHAKEARPVDFQPMEDHLTALREAVEANGGEIDFTPLAELLDAIRESTDSNAEVIKKLLESQEATREESVVDFTPLKEPLEAMRQATERNTEHLLSMFESQQSSAKTSRSADIDFTPLTDRLNRIHTTLQKQSAQRDQPPGTGDSKFIMNALTSHLSKIQNVTEQNAQHVKALREKQSSSSDKMHIAVSETSEQVRSLIKRNEENESRIEAQNSQMRELMSGQREMVEVMRSLTKSIVAQNKGACDHIVVPPPRKMGRKVVGFVYDAKEGAP